MSMWKQYLLPLTHRNKLIRPLGPWVSCNHQEWNHYIDLDTKMLYTISSNKVTGYNPITPKRIQTRANLWPWYDLEQPIHSAILPVTYVVPTTIHHDYVAHGFLAQANWSPNAPIAKSTQPEEQDRGDLFYSTMLTDTTIPFTDIASAASRHRLTISCAGYHDSVLKQASGTLSFMSNGELFSHSGPTIHGTKYRAELIAVMLALYILHKSESTLRSGNWKVTILCGLKSVVRDAFCNSPLGITQSTWHDYNILLEIQWLRC